MNAMANGNAVTVDGVARRLRELREQRGLTQKEVAKLSGIGDKTISAIETSPRAKSLTISQLLALLEAYGTTLHEAFCSPQEVADEWTRYCFHGHREGDPCGPCDEIRAAHPAKDKAGNARRGMMRFPDEWRTDFAGWGTKSWERRV